MSALQQIIRSDEKSAVFEAPSFASIKTEDLDQYFYKNINSTLIVRPKKCDMSDLDDLRKNVSNKYFVQIGFMAEKNDLVKSRENLTDCPLQSITPQNIESFRNLVSSTIEQYFSALWRDYIAQTTLDAFKQILADSVSVEKGRIIEFKGKPVAVIALFPHHDCLSKKVEQIGWVWVQEDLSDTYRDFTHQLLLRWLNGIVACSFQAGVHLHNVRSQKFFHKIGFNPECAHFTLK